MSDCQITPEGAGKRPLRIAAEIQRDLPEILRSHVHLPDGIMISIVDVKVSRDLGYAKIYFSILSENEEQAGDKTAHFLNHRKGVIRSELAKRLVMRHHPDLRFIYDPTPAQAARIEELLKHIKESSSSESSE